MREVDVADDLAFLVMDLVAHGGERFARALVRAYRDSGGDPGDDALIAFFAAYRALVRAKVALLRAAQQSPKSAVHGHHSAQARDLLSLAECFAWQARLPLVIVACGVPASGKTHLAEALAALSGLAHLSSDITRKRLAGVAPMLFVECRAPAVVLAQRAAKRDREPRRVPDATLSVVLREISSWEPLNEVAPPAHMTLRTDPPIEDLAAELLGLLDQRIGRIDA